MKTVKGLFLLGSVALLTACGQTEDATNEGAKELTLGIRENTIELWEEVGQQTAEQGLELDIVPMNSGIDINQATVDGDLDANAYQTMAYLETWNNLQNQNIVPAITTLIAPLGIYSEEYSSLEEIPDESIIGIPNDASNASRALELLEQAGLITLSEDFTSVSGTEAIEENPKNLEFELAEGAMLPRMLPDLDAALIINGTALDAGMKLEEALFHEDEGQAAYVNIVATTEENEETYSEELGILYDVIKSDEIKQFIEEEYEGNFISVEQDIEEVVETFKTEYRN